VENRLASINRPKNLKHTEQVLETKLPNASLEDPVGEMQEIDRKFAALLVPHHPSREPDSSIDTLDSLRGVPKTFRTVADIHAPSISMHQMNELLQLCLLIGLGGDRLIECGGAQCAQLIMQLLRTSGHRVQPRQGHHTHAVLFLVSDSQKSAFGLSAARHLANHEVRVHVTQLGDLQRDDVKKELHLFRSTAGTLSYGFKQVPSDLGHSMDMVVDALFDSTLPSSVSSPPFLVSFRTYIEWLHAQAVPVLSMDYPSGVHGTHGEMILPMLEGHGLDQLLRVRWIACLGLPKNCVLTLCETSPSLLSAQMFLVDIGIPSLILRKSGVLSATAPSPYLYDKLVIPLAIHPALPRRLSS
jgi:NAD(P)H-hydrate repair Nnr-like enzyme with NAD(P)H-hydrate epimerase domain